MKKTLGLLAILSLILTQVVQAQTIVIFGSETILSSDSNVNATGTAALAYDVNGVTTTVNNVAFSNSLTQNGVTLSFSGNAATATNTFAGANNPLSLSATFQSILAGAKYTSSSTGLTFTLSGLTVGDTYQAQLFTYDARAPYKVTETVTGAGDPTLPTPASGTLQYGNNTVSATNPAGSYVTATFAASSTSETFNFSNTVPTGVGSGNQLNAIDLRIVTVPEPSTYLLLGLGGIVLLIGYRRRFLRLVNPKLKYFQLRFS